jgi:hypothetical protein
MDEHITWKIRADLGCPRVNRVYRNGWEKDDMTL